MIKRLISSLLPSQSGRDQGRLSVVLDLDQTISYIFCPQQATGYQYIPDIHCDIFLQFPQRKQQLFIFKRPFLDDFLTKLDQEYEPILWSSGEKEYVDKVVDAIDPRGIFRYRLYQEHCSYQRAWNYPQFEFLKNLAILRGDLSRMVIIEDDWQGMYFQPDNYINIEKFQAFYEDFWLRDEIPSILEEMKNKPDVRPFLRSRFMMKYAWANQGMFYKLTQEDLKIAEFLGEGEHQYEQIKENYEEVFGIKTKYISSSKLW